jgi:hypothetical protein
MAYQKGKEMTEAKTEFKKETLKDVAGYKILAVPERGLLKEDAEYYGIRSSVSQEDGQTITATYYPYYNKEGKITGYKKRDWTKPKEDDFHFTVVGNVKISCKLFGQSVCKDKGKTVYIVEGEDEVWAVRRSILESLAGTQWAGKIQPNVVGLSMGTANAQDAVAHNEDFIRGFDEVVLCLNNDHATAKEALKGIKKGKEATEDVASFLLSGNISTVELPTDVNDFREAYLKGFGAMMGKRLAFERKAYSPEKIISGDEVTLDDLIKPLPVGLKITRYPKLMEMMQGFRHDPTGELTLWTAFSGVGKSTCVREIAWEILNQTELPVGFIFLEEKAIKTQQSMLALELGVPLNEFRKDALRYATREQIEAARLKVLANGRSFFLNHFGSMQTDRIMNQVKYLHHICGCKHIIIDHLSMVVSGLATTNERKDIDILLTELAAFVSSNDCHIHGVSHLKRVDDVPKKKAANEDAPEPYWREINLGYLRGSGGLEQLAFNVIAVENEVMPDGTRGRIRLKILKNREWGDLGVCDVLKQKEDGRLHDASDNLEF